jgi:phosphoenolpyruvate synthase/pyruvate phosphate dikinase
VLRPPATVTRLGLPVPPGFTVTTQACPRYHAPRSVAEQRGQAECGGDTEAEEEEDRNPNESR